MAKDSFSEGYQTMKFKSLLPVYRRLLLEAKKAMKTGHNPYTKTQVGAAVLTTNGSIISASNVVISAKWNSICAERSAIVKANSVGKPIFTAIAIIGRKGKRTTEAKKYIFTPCGVCRQFIYEFRPPGKDIDVIMSDLEMDRIIVMKISELLPLAYE